MELNNTEFGDDDGGYFQDLCETMLVLREDICEWLTRLFDRQSDPITPDNFMTSLDSGALLCSLSNMIHRLAALHSPTEPSCHLHQRRSSVVKQSDSDCDSPRGFQEVTANDTDPVEPWSSAASISKYRSNATSGSWFARDNIAVFLNWCRRRGIRDEVLFVTEGLVSHSQEKNVILTLLELARLGGNFGLDIPNVIRLEREIDRSWHSKSIDQSSHQTRCTSSFDSQCSDEDSSNILHRNNNNTDKLDMDVDKDEISAHEGDATSTSLNNEGDERAMNKTLTQSDDQQSNTDAGEDRKGKVDDMEEATVPKTPISGIPDAAVITDISEEHGVQGEVPADESSTAVVSDIEGIEAVGEEIVDKSSINNEKDSENNTVDESETVNDEEMKTDIIESELEKIPDSNESNNLEDTKVEENDDLTIEDTTEKVETENETNNNTLDNQEDGSNKERNEEDDEVSVGNNDSTENINVNDMGESTLGEENDCETVDEFDQSNSDEVPDVNDAAVGNEDIEKDNKNASSDELTRDPSSEQQEISNEDVQEIEDDMGNTTIMEKSDDNEAFHQGDKEDVTEDVNESEQQNNDDIEETEDNESNEDPAFQKPKSDDNDAFDQGGEEVVTDNINESEQQQNNDDIGNIEAIDPNEDPELEKSQLDLETNESVLEDNEEILGNEEDEDTILDNENHCTDDDTLKKRKHVDDDDIYDGLDPEDLELMLQDGDFDPDEMDNFGMNASNHQDQSSMDIPLVMPNDIPIVCENNKDNVDGMDGDDNISDDGGHSKAYTDDHEADEEVKNIFSNKDPDTETNHDDFNNLEDVPDETEPPLEVAKPKKEPAKVKKVKKIPPMKDWSKMIKQPEEEEHIPTPEEIEVDFQIGELTASCTCDPRFTVTKVRSCTYRLGGRLCFLRLLRGYVMVRVGGGWSTLHDYLRRHDPCRVFRFPGTGPQGYLVMRGKYKTKITDLTIP